MTGAPHPLRCETCNRPIGLIGGTNDCPISISSHLDVALVTCMGIIGCASHSSAAKESSNSKAAPSHARTSDDVLRSDKVQKLYKVQKLLRVIYSTCQETVDCPLASDGKTLARMIKLFIDNSELRQQQEREQNG